MMQTNTNCVFYFPLQIPLLFQTVHAEAIEALFTINPLYHNLKFLVVYDVSRSHSPIQTECRWNHTAQQKASCTNARHWHTVTLAMRSLANCFSITNLFTKHQDVWLNAAVTHITNWCDPSQWHPSKYLVKVIQRIFAKTDLKINYQDDIRPTDFSVICNVLPEHCFRSKDFNCTYN